jgi:hypothetical protein
VNAFSLTRWRSLKPADSKVSLMAL